MNALSSQTLTPTCSLTTPHDRTENMSYQLFAMGNPLLDMQVTNGEGLLQKYELKSNDAILAEEKHQPMCVVLYPQSCFSG